jgi:D-alanine-D-alanine ligase
MAALEQAGHEVVPLGINKTGRWLHGGDPMRALTGGGESSSQHMLMLPEPGHNDAQLDVIFPVLHGTYGEDGTVQGLFELASVPYVGAGVLGSALGMDKVVQKTLWRGLGLPVVDFMTMRRNAVDLDRLEREIGYPCFVKPANLGSSVGVNKARNRDELRVGLQDAARYDAKLVVEKGVDARELEVAVLGNENPVASVVGEILPGAEFYDYRAKYIDSGSQAIIPADIAPEVAQEVQRLAVRAFKAIDASGLARVDFFLERGTDTLYINEINTMPGFTNISMYPKLWEASGVSFPELVARLVELAEERFAERAQNETSFQTD